MTRTARNYLLLIALTGLCSCVHAPPKHFESADPKASIFVAAVHNVPLEGEPHPNAWVHVSSILKQAGIRHYMESSSGVASIMAQSDRSHEAVDLIRKDATQRGYWMYTPKEFQ